MSGKGKEKVSDKGKRKWTAENDNEKTRGSKRKNRNVLQFFDDVAYQVDDDVDDFSDSDLDGFEDEDFFSEINAKDAPKKVPEAPFVPKEEVMSEEEFDRIMEERYKPGSGFVKFAEEDGGYEDKRSVDGSSIYAPSAKDQPKIWKVKCTAGRERYTAFCLMQKYVDREFLGSKMPIVSAFSPDQLKGFILIEADKQGDIYEASKGITSIYPTRVTPIPSKEFSRMLCVRSKSSGISEGMWARVKNGKYKGDLASVVAVNDAKKKVTVKLIPRIDLKALAEKFGGGVAPKRAAIPPQRLISSSELDEFRPLIHSRRDRDTNEMVEVLDGMMLKDGYMYKKVSVDSLIIWGVVPTDDELLKFEPSKKDDSTNVQWLSQLFGENKKEHAETVMKQDKGSGKSEGSTSATKGSNSESHDLVFFGRKDFGVVLGQEKDDCVKVLTEGSDGQSVVTVKRSDLKSASFDKKLFFALDQNSHSVSINDIVRVLSGPLKERQGTVKKIYKGVLFLWDESEHENSGYLCVKAKSCEKVNLSGKESHGKDNGPGPSGFADYSSSPKSPLSPDNSFQEKSNKITFQQREDDGMFSVGQSLRIRVGPLKGYLCRALAIRRSDVTVKLDSQQKILTVKAEHLSEVRGRNASISQGEESGSIKPFDFLGTQNGASDWTAGAPSSTEGNGWNAGGSTERSSWTNFDSSNSLVSKEPGSADPVGDNANKGTENSSWQIKASTESSPWGVAEAKQVTNQGTSGWGTSNSGWNQSTSSKAVDRESDSWGKAAAVDTHVVKDNSWGAAAAEKQAGGAWNASGDGAAAASGSQWGKNVDVKKDDDNAKSWGKVDASSKSWDNTQMAIDAAPKENHRNDGWNKVNPVGAADSEPSWNKKNDKSGWGKVEGASAGSKQDVGTSWSKPTEKSLDAQQSDFNKGSNRSDDWVSLAKSAGDDTSGGGWNVSKGSADKNIKYTGWGGASTGNEGSGNGGGGSWDNKVIKPNGGGGSWGSSAKSDGDNTAGGGWNVSKDSADKNIKSSGWSGASMGNEGSGNGGGGSWDNKVIKPNGGGGSWGSSAKSDGDNTAGGWNVSKDSSDKNIKSSGWGGASMGNEGSGNGGGDSWDSKVIKPNDSTNSSWKANGNNQSSSDWSAKGDWGSVSEKKSPGGGDGAWKNVDGESSTGWGKSNWGKSGASGDGNQESGWSRRGNQSFGDSSNQDNYSGDRGRGGRWSGGRGDRGGFRGRGRFDFNGNQDDSFSGRGRGSRWGEGRSGRGGYDQEGGGFRGRGGGGFRGRGRGDFSYEDKSEGWKNSNENSEGWKSGGGNSEGWKNSGGGGGWNQTANDNNQQKREATTGGGWNTNNNGRSNVSPKKAQPGSWGSAPAASGNSSGNWDMLDKNDEGPSGSWGKGAPSSWGAGSGKW